MLLIINIRNADQQAEEHKHLLPVFAEEKLPRQDDSVEVPATGIHFKQVHVAFQGVPREHRLPNIRK
jgi:hypothetical protein